MAFADEKDPVSLVSPVSPDLPNHPASANLDKRLPELREVEFRHPPYPRNPPKRKPVPIAKPATTPNETKSPGPKGPGPTAIPQWLDWRQFSRQKRLIVVGAVAAVILVVLVIGLAVGLTVGNGHKALPLPTSYGGPYHGDLTYYTPALGACGIVSSVSDMVCAVSHVIFDAASTGSNPNENPLCGLKLRLKRGGESVDVKVVDRCVGCEKAGIDVSPAVFRQLANPVHGRVPVRWTWLEDPER
ncbi:riboflavin aldehyde-forming enzyme [Aspergillus sp. HF37]|nr:riboflavin aldehyde-forming enzyme [Aspergillus sp. HF37]